MSTSPVEKKIAFLESKNLTKEEVDVAFARAGENAPISGSVNANQAAHPAFATRQIPSYGYGPYQPSPWGPPPPP